MKTIKYYLASLAMMLVIGFILNATVNAQFCLFTRNTQLSGTVTTTSGGVTTPVANYTVFVQSEADPSVFVQVFTDSNGFYIATNLFTCTQYYVYHLQGMGGTQDYSNSLPLQYTVSTGQSPLPHNLDFSVSP